MTTGTALLAASILAVFGVTAAVYRDSRRLEMERPLLWTAFVFTTTGGGVFLIVATSIPVPGVLVIVVGGIAIYLFERDDQRHGDAPADPRTLEGPARSPPEEDES